MRDVSQLAHRLSNTSVPVSAVQADGHVIVSETSISGRDKFSVGTNFLFRHV